jgi:hypothetical protein
LIWLKGDWAEAHHSLGMPSVTSHNCPCPFCALKQPSLRDHYYGCGDLPLPAGYHQAVRSHEVHVLISTETQRVAIVNALRFKRGDKGFGRELFVAVRVGGQSLLPQDRLEPTAVLPDVLLLDNAPLPIRAVLWRAGRDDRGRLNAPPPHSAKSSVQRGSATHALGD